MSKEDMAMSAELIRKAATILRERAKAADGAVGDEPWKSDSLGWCDPHGTTYQVTTNIPGDDEVYPVAHAGIEESAAYIATMHPGVGLALADWLSATEEHVASYDCEAHCEPDGCGPTRRAATLARLIVGEQP